MSFDQLFTINKDQPRLKPMIRVLFMAFIIKATIRGIELWPVAKSSLMNLSRNFKMILSYNRFLLKKVVQKVNCPNSCVK